MDIFHLRLYLTHWPLEDVAMILKVQFSNSFHRTFAMALAIEPDY